MRVAYLDTSAIVAIAFGEPEGMALAERMEDFDEWLSANLLEAETRAAFHREEVEYPPDLLARLTWVLPDRPISSEIDRALEAGYLRGADLWHVAAALFVFPNPSAATFMTLDASQRAVAERLGFQT